MDTILLPLAGGVLIGLAAGAFLLLSGRIAGISGVLGGLLAPVRGSIAWRVAFLIGLFGGGFLLLGMYPSAFPEAIHTPYSKLIAAGLLVGFGTRLGSGCTSGHGVCGLGRFSPRSLIATGTFVFTGVVTVLLVSVFGG
jgi:uncharacterized membrane protein YedE/YeeE